MSLEPTIPMDEFLVKYRKDDNEWWRLDSGDMQNLFEEAVERLEAAERENETLQGHVDHYLERAVAAERRVERYEKALRAIRDAAATLGWDGGITGMALFALAEPEEGESDTMES